MLKRQYDNISLWCYDGDSDPEVTPGPTATSAEGLEVTAPALGETGGYITVANSAKTLAVFIVYTVSYNDDETLASFSSAPCEV